MNILFIRQNFSGRFKHLAPGPARQAAEPQALKADAPHFLGDALIYGLSLAGVGVLGTASG